MNTLYSIKNISHIHWQPVWDTTHNWTTTSCSITYKTRKSWQTCLGSVSFSPVHRSTIAVITCVRQLDTILLSNAAKKPQLTLILLHNPLRLWPRVGPTFFLLFCAVLHWTQYGFLHFKLWSYTGFNQDTFGIFFALVRKEMAPIFFCKINLTLWDHVGHKHCTSYMLNLSSDLMAGMCINET
jgi:hypothetical protein